MRILLIASSARGHAIADALTRSHHKPDIIALSPSANPGLIETCAEHIETDILDFDAVLSVAKSANVDFAFIGPDDPIGAGLTDVLEAENISCVAPRKLQARIESSKGYTRDLLKKYGIDASPKYKVFTKADRAGIASFLTNDLQEDFVVKYDALKGGKGVKLSGEHLDTTEDGIAYALECVEECGRVVLEEKLVGAEFSLISFVSGTQVVDCPAVQDHKRAFAGDTGPNTGGMGTYSDANHSLPFLSEEDLQAAKDINRRVAGALLEDCNGPYRGILYGGFIATRNGVRVIEYNARFGDPEALNILPLLESDFVDLCQSMIHGELTEDAVQFAKKATVCKYITPEGYPENKDQKGATIQFPAVPENARLYFGDIARDKDGTLRLGGSRTAGIVGMGETIAEAEQIAEELCQKVQGPVRHRSDIGTAELIQKRVDLMQGLRRS